MSAANVVALTGEIIPLKPKSDDQQILDDLGQDAGQQAIEVCERISSEPLGLEAIAAEVIGREGPAAARLFYRWRVRSSALVRMYARACQSRAHVMVHRMMDVIEQEACPHKARVKMDAMKWMAGKLNRADFGDEPHGQVGLSVTINNDQNASVLEEIRQRLNRKRKSLKAQELSMLSHQGGVVESGGEGEG